MRVSLNEIQKATTKAQDKILMAHILCLLLEYSESGEYGMHLTVADKKFPTGKPDCPYIEMDDFRMNALATALKNRGFDITLVQATQDNNCKIYYISFKEADYDSEAGALREYTDLLMLDTLDREQLIRLIELFIAKAAYHGKTRIKLDHQKYHKEILDEVLKLFKDEGFAIKKTKDKDAVICW